MLSLAPYLSLVLFSDNESIASSVGSMFNSGPDSPDSWNFDTNVTEESAAKSSLESRLRDCKISENGGTAAKLYQKHIPSAGKLTIVKRLERDVLLERAKCQRGQLHTIPAQLRSLSSSDLIKRFSAVIKLSPNIQDLSQTLPQTLLQTLPQTLPLLPRVKPPSIALKIKITCPDEDEILAIKIQKERLRSVRELVDAVNMKLKIRYCMRPDDLVCRLSFPDKTLEPVDLCSGEVGTLLDDFIMEYIQTRLKIYVEVRVKEGRRWRRTRMSRKGDFEH